MLKVVINIKILFVSPYFYPEVGGAENYVYNISKRLVERGHEITVVCSDKKNGKDSINGVNIIKLKVDFTISRTPIKIGLINIIRKLLLDNEYDIININFSVPYFPEIAAFLSKFYKLPSVLTYHNDMTKNGLFMNTITNLYNISLNRTLLNSVDLIITTSPFCYYESRFLKPFKNKLTYIPPGVEYKKYVGEKSFEIHDLYKIPHTSNIVLFVGVISKAHAHKGVKELIKAFKNVLRQIKDVYLVLVGGGDMVLEYQELSKKLGINNKVIFTGFIPEDDLIKYYKNSDMVVLPTTTSQEGFGMVLIEGNASGKPVIGTKIGGIQYVIEEGKNGLLVPPKDTEALSDSIIKLLREDELAKRMGKMGKKIVKKKYNWDRATEMTEKAFKELI